MKRHSFFSYFPISEEVRQWEIYATSFGYVRMEENAKAYPPDRHPAGHHFVWEEGRILPGSQLLCIHAGRGEFESALTKRVRVQPGTTILLHPGIWHRYRPLPGTGWTESWIELHGEQMDRLRKNGTLDPAKPVYRPPRTPEMEQGWERAFQMAWTKPPGFTVHLGLIALELLLRLQENSPAPDIPRHIEAMVSRAQTILSADTTQDEATIEELARQLGVGYSYFRRAFKKQTGFSPKQYHNEVRFRRVKGLLANTSLSIKEIAAQLGYSSPYHLTKDFTQRARMAPSLWREGMNGRDRSGVSSP